MKQSLKHFAWASVGLSLALTAGSPAIADDTELLLATPNSTGADRPNILFILDTSGSMTTIERTQQPYDKDEDYGGTCQSDRYYWTSGNSIPECRTDAGALRGSRKPALEARASISVTIQRFEPCRSFPFIFD